MTLISVIKILKIFYQKYLFLCISKQSSPPPCRALAWRGCLLPSVPPTPQFLLPMATTFQVYIFSLFVLSSIFLNSIFILWRRYFSLRQQQIWPSYIHHLSPPTSQIIPVSSTDRLPWWCRVWIRAVTSGRPVKFALSVWHPVSPRVNNGFMSSINCVIHSHSLSQNYKYLLSMFRSTGHPLSRLCEASLPATARCHFTCKLTWCAVSQVGPRLTCVGSSVNCF